MKINNETKVGILATISITILILGYNFMKGENLFTTYNTYYSYYEDVEGLFKSNPVMINGYKVGQVSDVTMDPKSLNILVEIQVPDNIKVSKDAIIKIVNTDLIGSKGIHIIMGKSFEIAKSGDTLNSDKDQGMAKAMSKLITPISEKLNLLLTELTTQISGDQISATLASLNKTLKTFDQAVASMEKVVVSKDAKLNGILGDMNAMTTDLKKATPKVDAILTNLEGTTADLKEANLSKTVEEIKAAVAEINATFDALNDGKGTLGKLATDESVYKKLESTIENINKLVIDIEKYPGRYTGLTKGQRNRAEKEKKKSEK